MRVLILLLLLISMSCDGGPAAPLPMDTVSETPAAFEELTILGEPRASLTGATQSFVLPPLKSVTVFKTTLSGARRVRTVVKHPRFGGDVWGNFEIAVYLNGVYSGGASWPITYPYDFGYSKIVGPGVVTVVLRHDATSRSTGGGITFSVVVSTSAL